MWWQYLLVFIGALLFDVAPFPFPPAFTIMVFLQIMFDLNIWWVIVIGVAGSILEGISLLYIFRFFLENFLSDRRMKTLSFLAKK